MHSVLAPQCGRIVDDRASRPRALSSELRAPAFNSQIIRLLGCNIRWYVCQRLPRHSESKRHQRFKRCNGAGSNARKNAVSLARRPQNRKCHGGMREFLDVAARQAITKYARILAAESESSSQDPALGPAPCSSILGSGRRLQTLPPRFERFRLATEAPTCWCAPPCLCG